MNEELKKRVEEALAAIRNPFPRQVINDLVAELERLRGEVIAKQAAIEMLNSMNDELISENEVLRKDAESRHAI